MDENERASRALLAMLERINEQLRSEYLRMAEELKEPALYERPAKAPAREREEKG